MEWIPREIWMEIFLFLNYKDIPSISSVCKQWTNIVKPTSDFWQFLFHQRWRDLDIAKSILFPQNNKITTPIKRKKVSKKQRLRRKKRAALVLPTPPIIKSPINWRQLFMDRYLEERRHLRNAFGYFPQLISNSNYCKKLTDEEITAIEFNYEFLFPPGNRFIYPYKALADAIIKNDFSSLVNDEKILILHFTTSFIHNIVGQMCTSKWYPKTFGKCPENLQERAEIVKEILKKAPKLIPISGDLFIPVTPHACGNPIFRVRPGFGIYCEYKDMNALIEACRNPVSPLEKLISLSKGPRYIPFWSDFVEETFQ